MGPFQKLQIRQREIATNSETTGQGLKQMLYTLIKKTTL